MTTVYKDGKLDLFWAAKVVEGVHSCADAASGVEHIVDKNDYPALNRYGDIRGPHGSPCQRDIVAIEADIQLPNGRSLPLELLYEARQPPCQRDSSGVKSDQHELSGAPVPLEDLVGDPRQGPSDLFRLQNGPRQKKPLAAVLARGRNLAPSRLDKGPRYSAPCQPHWTDLKGISKFVPLYRSGPTVSRSGSWLFVIADAGFRDRDPP